MRLRDIEKIHEAGLRILECTGVVFHCSDALALLSQRGFSVDGQRVRMAADDVETCIRSAPTSFVLRGRSPRPDLVFGEDLIVATTGGSSSRAGGP